jgi:hypothetical protein
MAKAAFKFKIDNQNFENENQFITGAQLKTLAKVPSDYSVWLKVTGPGADRKIENDEQVDLSHPGTEHFFTGKPNTTEG